MILNNIYKHFGATRSMVSCEICITRVFFRNIKTVSTELFFVVVVVVVFVCLFLFLFFFFVFWGGGVLVPFFQVGNPT